MEYIIIVAAVCGTIGSVIFTVMVTYALATKLIDWMLP